MMKDALGNTVQPGDEVEIIYPFDLAIIGDIFKVEGYAGGVAGATRAADRRVYYNMFGRNSRLGSYYIPSEACVLINTTSDIPEPMCDDLI